MPHDPRVLSGAKPGTVDSLGLNISGASSRMKPISRQNTRNSISGESSIQSLLYVK